MPQRSTFARVAALVSLMAAALVLGVASARAWHDADPGANVYFGWDWLSASEAHGSAYDNQSVCIAAAGSHAVWSTYYGFITVALINGSGGWVRSAQSDDYDVDVFVNPNTLAEATSYNKKAHCVNSGGTELWAACERLYWIDSSHCA